MNPLAIPIASLRLKAAKILLFLYIIGPFAISAQYDHLLGGEQSIAKFLESDVTDTIHLHIEQIQLRDPISYYSRIYSETQITICSVQINPRSGRAPPSHS